MNIDRSSNQASRASFSQAPCGNFEPGPHHAGHMKCIRMKRRIEARIRSKRSDEERAVLRRKRALEALVAKSTTEHRRK
jgi:hypothetical protein